MERSCIDCAAPHCGKEKGTFPAFCVTQQMPEEVKVAAMAEYDDPGNRKIMSAAAEVEYTGYRKWTRVQEIMEFARRMGYKKIGIATCIGLIRESRTFAKILRSHGFEVFGIVCKAGMVQKVDVGIDEKCNALGCNMCNPILQAKRLNAEKTDLNVVVGLCVGHDSLFYKYSEAVTTTLITKDRVTGHNPAVPLYTAESYYKTLMGEETV